MLTHETVGGLDQRSYNSFFFFTFLYAAFLRRKQGLRRRKHDHIIHFFLIFLYACFLRRKQGLRRKKPDRDPRGFCPNGFFYFLSAPDRHIGGSNKRSDYIILYIARPDLIFSR